MYKKTTRPTAFLLTCRPEAVTGKKHLGQEKSGMHTDAHRGHFWESYTIPCPASILRFTLSRGESWWVSSLCGRVSLLLFLAFLILQGLYCFATKLQIQGWSKLHSASSTSAVRCNCRKFNPGHRTRLGMWFREEEKKSLN